MPFSLALLAQYLLAASAALQAQPSSLDESSIRSGTAIGQVILFLTTVAGFIYTIYRENRNRQWDLQDRERARTELMQKVDTTQAKLVRVVEVAEEQQATILNKIDENTKISESAFKEANDVNRKIANLTEVYKQASGRRRGLSDGAEGQ